MKKSTFSPTDTAILAAFCVFLSIIEYMIPKPMPFMRIGLANLPILLSLLIFPVRETLLLTLLKVLGQGLINGTLFSYIFLFSAAGSISSILIMIAVYHILKTRVSLAGVSVCGAMASNIVQILLARQFIFGEAAILIAPPFLAIGLVSSVLLGMFSAGFASRSKWIARRLTGEMPMPVTDAAVTPAAVTPAAVAPEAGDEKLQGAAPTAGPARFAFICGLLAVPGFVFQPDAAFAAAGAVLFIIYSAVLGKKFRLLPNLVMAVSIIAANLLTPFGRIVAEIGPLKITTGALETGLGKTALIIGLIYISRASVRKGLSFPGRFGSLLSLVFYYFERLTEGNRIKRSDISTGKLFEVLDNKLLELEKDSNNLSFSATGTKSPGAAKSRTGAIKYFVALILPITSWGLFAAELLL